MKLLSRLLAVGWLLTSAASAAVWPVSIAEFVFTPATVNIGQGDTVIWTNTGALRHSTTSGTGGIPDGIWNSGIMDPTATFSHAFPNIGSFPYFCSLHLGMTGTVVVGPAGGFEEGRQVPVPSSMGLAVSPNPVRWSASIRYRPRGANPVSLEVLDLNGRLVRTLEPGTERALWDGTDNEGRQVQASVYIIRLSRGGNQNYARLVKLQ